MCAVLPPEGRLVRPRAPSRRRSLHPVAVLALSLWLSGTWPVRPAAAAASQALPPPALHPPSTEICLNSRISYHGGWSGTASDQAMGDILHAAAQAPLTAGPCQLYVATDENVYRYDAATHSLTLHQAGDARTDPTSAFEIGFAAANDLDAGMAMHLAQLESIAHWTGTAGQLASCPRGTATEAAQYLWHPLTPIQIVVCFGMREVQGLTSTPVAVSSDGSLPGPATDGSAPLDDAIAGLTRTASFDAQTLTTAELSQLLWGAYGCNDHRAAWIPGTAGLVCPSGLAQYYLTRRIYAVRADGVYRFHVRLPPGTDATTRDHRIELLTGGDARAALRAAAPALPEAPLYLILCVGETGQLPELEVGFAAAGAMLEASSLGLHGHTTQDLPGAVQAAVRGATGIPVADLPMAIVALGHPAVADVGDPAETGAALRLWIVNAGSPGGGILIRYALPDQAPVQMSLYDVFGHRVRDFAAAPSGAGLHTIVWDGRGADGKGVPSGIYFCRLVSAGRVKVARAPVIR